MDRVKKRTVNLIASAGTLTHTVEYGFTANGTNTSLQVSDYVSKISGVIVNQYQYVYDNNGNITQIKNASGVVQYQYAYDDLGQLVREDNRALNKSYTYSYDNAGNITSRKTYAFTTGTLGTATNTESYTYGNASWGDLVTSINGYSITYDAVGNPLTYYTGGLDSVLTWTNGRQLASFENMDGLRTYTYNDEGIRISRTVNGVEHKYQLNGTQIVSETWGNHTIFYIYDEMGTIAGMRYRTSSYAEGVFDEYLFEKNFQGDVVAIYNVSGTKLVSYTYDAWGKVTATYSNGGASTGARYNPFRYRGYYYDEDTGLYYLNTRYYDPSIGRFISPDIADVIALTPNALTDKNLYAYCDNNPIMRKDDGGEFWHLIVGAAVGVVTQYVSDVVTNLIDGKSFVEALQPSSTWADYGAAALSGALAASGVGLGVSVAANAAIGGTTYLANCAIKGEDANMLDFGLSVGAGMISGLVGGSGADGSNLRGVVNTSKEILKTAVSPKKIAMYTAKLLDVKKTVVISTLRTIAAGTVSNGLNYGRRLITNGV